LTEAGSRALAGVGLSDIKRGRVVLMNHDPRVELPRIHKRIRARIVGGTDPRRSEADDQQAGSLEESPPMCGKDFFDLLGNP